MASSSGNKQLFPHGSITELFSFQTSAVVLMGYDENETIKLLGLGNFVIYLITQATRPILTTVCSVDGFHWPLAKDTVICRMAKRTFGIALPGLLYGLQFPQFCEEALVDSLERVFIKFGHYYKVPTDDKGLGYPLEDNELLMWYKLRLRVEPTAHEILKRLGQLPGRSRFCVSNHNPSYLRAIRMSATTKLIVDGMISLGILSGSHIVVAGTNPHPHQPDEESQITAYASVSVFTCLVDSLEAAEVISCGLGHLIKATEPPLQTGFTNIGFRVWKLNEQGLLAFIHDLGSAVEREKQILNDKEEKWKAKDKEREEAHASASTSATASASTSAAASDCVAPNDKGKDIKP